MTDENLYGVRIPKSLYEELEKIAIAKGRTVAELHTEIYTRYLVFVEISRDPKMRLVVEMEDGRKIEVHDSNSIEGILGEVGESF